MWLPDAPPSEHLRNNRLKKAVTQATELNEYKLWLTKLKKLKVKIGA